MDHRETQIEILTTSDRLIGTLRLPRDGYRSRLSDFLNAGDRSFIALTDVAIAPLSGGESVHRDVVLVSLGHIVLAMPQPGGADAIAELE